MVHLYGMYHAKNGFVSPADQRVQTQGRVGVYGDVAQTYW